jgi:hypothetical protein
MADNDDFFTFQSPLSLHSDRQLHYSAYAPQQPPPFSYLQSTQNVPQNDAPTHPLQYHHMHHHLHEQNLMNHHHHHLSLPIADAVAAPPPRPLVDDELVAYNDELLEIGSLLHGHDDVYGSAVASTSQLGKRPRAAVEPPAFALSASDDADLMSLYERLGLDARDFDFVADPPLPSPSAVPPELLPSVVPTTAPVDKPLESAVPAVPAVPQVENRCLLPLGFGADPTRTVPVNERQYARILKRRVQRATRALTAVERPTKLESNRKKRADEAARDKVGRFALSFD